MRFVYKYRLIGISKALFALLYVELATGIKLFTVFSVFEY